MSPCHSTLLQSVNIAPIPDVLPYKSLVLRRVRRCSALGSPQSHTVGEFILASEEASLPARPNTLICIRPIVNFFYPASLKITVHFLTEILFIYTKNEYPCKMPRVRLVGCFGRDEDIGGGPIRVR